MIICKNKSDVSRMDNFGRNGYTASCTKEECQSLIEDDECTYFAVKVGQLNQDEIFQKYQTLNCYKCG